MILRVGIWKMRLFRLDCDMLKYTKLNYTEWKWLISWWLSTRCEIYTLKKTYKNKKYFFPFDYLCTFSVIWLCWLLPPFLNHLFHNTTTTCRLWLLLSFHPCRRSGAGHQCKRTKTQTLVWVPQKQREESGILAHSHSARSSEHRQAGLKDAKRRSKQRHSHAHTAVSLNDGWWSPNCSELTRDK